MEAGDRSIEKWIQAIENGRLQLPRFQRFEAWGAGQVADLLKTVVDGLPAGAALILKVSGQPPFKTRPLETAPTGPDSITELLLDGQQRLTALWRALNDTYEGTTFFVKLTPDQDEVRGYQVLAQTRYEKDRKIYPLWADQASKVLGRDLIPFRLLRPGAVGEQMAKDWIHSAVEGDQTKENQLTWAVNRLRNGVANFNLPFLFLPDTTDKPVVLEVFVKMNTRAEELTAFDIIVAEVEGELGESLHDLVRSLRGQVPRLERYVDPADLALNAMALLQDRVPNQTGYFGIRWDTAIEAWPALVDGAKRTVTFLEDERIFDGARLPTIVPIPVMTALYARSNETPDGLGNVRLLMRRYLWCSAFTTRYEFAAATSSLQDFRALLPSVEAGSKEADAPIFAQSLPSASELLVAGWPKKRDRLARAILLLSFRGGALDLADEAPVNAENIAKREYHHLFPVAYLHRRGSGLVPDLALNCALITWKTNRTISDNSPLQYMKDRAEQAALGELALKHRLASHAIPYAPLAAEDYETFLLERAEILETAVQTLCAGRSWSPKLD